jgi:hypothetical protein
MLALKFSREPHIFNLGHQVAMGHKG